MLGRTKKPGHWSEGKTPPVTVRTSGELSHYGRKGVFRESPRWEKEYSLSMTSGRLSADELWFRMVRGEKTAPPGSEVRIFEAGDLASADYLVVDSPTYGNDLHVSVGAPLQPGATKDAHREWWERSERVPLSVLAKEVISVEN